MITMNTTKDFILLPGLLNTREMMRIHRTAMTLGLQLHLNADNNWRIIGLDPTNRPEVEAFFSLADIDIN